MLELFNVSKTLGKFELDNISFKLPKGYIMGLVGQNGSGKTSIINIILGLYKIKRGHVLVDGMDITEYEKEVKDRIGFVLCDDLFHPYLSLLENANLYGKYYSKYSKEEFVAYCERFQIDANKKLSKFSTGQKLKFQFAFALSHKPKLLLLDEPVGNFDPEFRKEFLAILSEFIEDGEHSILISTNTTMELEAMADYITMIKRGKIVFSMEKEAMCEKYKLVKGEECKIDLIDKDRIIYKESGSYQTTALVLNDEFSEYDRELVVEAPSIDDVMYYIVKGDEN
ncbi:MAG: ABC transporter ATP-binding protein, partial [Intestinibacter sp.]|uniref:ABC transporter ATP-binding protein n=1 Tax=Intestinibacter sp. TaxID=1965304 RepID=UPI003F1532F1